MKRNLAVVLSAAAVACADGSAPAPSPSARASLEVPAATSGGTTVPASPAAIYEIRGKVKSVDHVRMTVNLDHEAIPGLMAAMEMEYKVRSHTLLDGITAGASVEGRLEASGADYVIVGLKKR